MFILFACAAAKFRDFLKILQNLHREMWQRFSAFQTAFGQRSRRRKIIFDWEKHLRCRNLLGILPRKPANNSANLDWFYGCNILQTHLHLYMTNCTSFGWWERQRQRQRRRQRQRQGTKARKRSSPAAPAAPSLIRVSAWPRTAITCWWRCL